MHVTPPPARGQSTFASLLLRLDAAEVAHRAELARLAGIDAELTAALTPGDRLDAGIRRSWCLDRVAHLADAVAAAERDLAQHIAGILVRHAPANGGDE